MAVTTADQPTTKDLLDAGVQSFANEEEKDKGQPKDLAAQIDSLLSKLYNDEEEGNSLQPLYPGHHWYHIASPP